MKLAFGPLAAAVALVSISSFASAATLFSEAGESLSSYTLVSETARTSSGVIDYSTLGIPEAPGQIAGSAATTGIQLTANKGTGTGTNAGINAILGSTPITFTGTHTLQYYVWYNIPSGATGTTEHLLGGVGRQTSDTALMSFYRSGRGSGNWFIMAGDNGSTTDYRQLDNGTQQYGYDAAAPELKPKLDAAFTGALSGANAAANEWVKVNIVLDAATSTASFYFNNVFFFSGSSTNTSGLAWFGHEDLNSSVGVGVSAIYDNVQVFEGNTVPEPTTLAALAGLGGLTLARRRKAR